MSTDNMVGRTVAGYHLAKYIGEGGTATVYRADHPEKGAAAVKLLRPRLAQDPIAVKRFLREAEYGSRVTHPNIVRTYDYGESDGLHYLALEWAKGEPLAEFVNRSGKLAPILVAGIIEQLIFRNAVEAWSYIYCGVVRPQWTRPARGATVRAAPSCSMIPATRIGAS